MKSEVYEMIVIVIESWKEIKGVTDEYIGEMMEKHKLITYIEQNVDELEYMSVDMLIYIMESLVDGDIK